jgi:hypothetical protein
MRICQPAGADSVVDADYVRANLNDFGYDDWVDGYLREAIEDALARVEYAAQEQVWQQQAAEAMYSYR